VELQQQQWEPLVVMAMITAPTVTVGVVVLRQALVVMVKVQKIIALLAMMAMNYLVKNV
jgi:hypothetical protein